MKTRTEKLTKKNNLEIIKHKKNMHVSKICYNVIGRNINKITQRLNTKDRYHIILCHNVEIEILRIIINTKECSILN